MGTLRLNGRQETFRKSAERFEGSGRGHRHPTFPNFANGSPRRASYARERKHQMTIRIDGDVIEWFKAQGKGYQTHMNAVLREYVKAQRK